MFGLLWTNTGPIDILIDDHLAASVDCSKLPEDFASRIGDGALPSQLLFSSDYLSPGDHTISVIVKEPSEPGRVSGVGIEALEYLDDGEPPQSRQQECSVQQHPDETCPADQRSAPS